MVTKQNIVSVLLVVAVIALVAGVAAMKSGKQEQPPVNEQVVMPPVADPAPATVPAPAPEAANNANVPANYSSGPAPVVAQLPRLIEVGGEKCIPCMQMAPIIEELQQEYEGRVDIIKIDVGKDYSALKKYGVRLIPTQVFLKADGQEFWRNEGTLTREEIVAKFVEMGIR